MRGKFESIDRVSLFVMKTKFFIVLNIAVFWSCFAACPAARAFVTPHPVTLYEKGDRLLAGSSETPQGLTAAKQVFQTIILKYPDSPLGYLGMSRAVTAEARLFGTHYNMQLLHDEALPFAVKALELGPLGRAGQGQYFAKEKNV
jgi:hypothetical protein